MDNAEFYRAQIRQLEQGIAGATMQLAEAEDRAQKLRVAIDMNRGAVAAYRQMLERETAAAREEPPGEA